MKTYYANEPRCFRDLSAEQQNVLLDWIRAVLVPAKSIFRRTSYGMKHDFEREPDGFYVWNGMFKGAMRAAGFEPVDLKELNWHFRVKPVRQLDEDEKTRLGVVGRNWLVRDRWREKGYMNVQRSRRRRIQEHIKTCQREQRPKLLVLRGAGVAEIILDTHPADYQLSDAATAEIAALFDSLNPSGRNWSITNNCQAVIRRVPLHQAEEVAEKLLEIANQRWVEADRDRPTTNAVAPTGD